MYWRRSGNTVTRSTFANINASERMFWRNTIVPELKFLEDQLNRMLLPKLGYPDLTLEFDLASILAKVARSKSESNGLGTP